MRLKFTEDDTLRAEMCDALDFLRRDNDQDVMEAVERSESDYLIEHKSLTSKLKVKKQSADEGRD